MKNLIVLLAFIFSVFSLEAQINNYIYSNNQYADTLFICQGEPLYLSVAGGLLVDDFNSGSLSNLWSANCSPQFTNPCGPSVDGSIYLWVGDATCFPRELTTIPLSVTTSTQICFDMRYAVQGESSPCEGPDLTNEGVHVQYSLDGTTWADIDYWDPNGGHDPNLTTWNHYVVNVSPGAVSTHTQFRWYQDVTSGNGYDNWGIDNVAIQDAVSTATWLENGTPFSNSFILPPQHPDSNTIYSVEIFTPSDTLYDSLFVIIDTTCLNFSGYVYEDENLNCILDSGEAISPVTPVQLFKNNVLLKTQWTDTNGYYEFYAPTDTASYTLSLGQMSSSCYGVGCPPAGYYVVDTSSSSLNFGLQDGLGFDLSVLAYTIGYVPGVYSGIYIFLNSSCFTQPGQLIMVHTDTLVNIFSASIPPDQTIGDSLIWNFSSPSDLNYLYVVVYTDSSAWLGHIVCNDFYVLPTSGDNDTSNNHFTLCDVVSTSLDPNNKNVTPVGTGTEGYIQPDIPLVYTIHFQNTGTAPAQNVVVFDTLDTNLDKQSVEILDYSHPVNASLNGNILEFQFNDIMLPDSGTDYNASMGHVIYKVNQNPGLPPLTHIYNNAAIFFDYNEPVITNYTLNTIENPVSIVLAKQDKHQVKLYPNPASNVINIESTANFNLEVFDIYGHLMLTKMNCEKLSSIDISHLQSGVYLIRIDSKNFVETARIIKL